MKRSLIITQYIKEPFPTGRPPEKLPIERITKNPRYALARLKLGFMFAQS